MKLLFWNTNKNDVINKYITDIVSCYKIDIIILAEYNDSVDMLCKDLSVNSKYYKYDSPGCKRITIVGHLKNLSPGFHNNYCSIQVINDQMILCSMHLPSNLYAGTNERSAIIREVLPEIELLESCNRTKNTIIVGDFNEAPYEYTCLGADTLHGIPSFEDANKLTRTSYNSIYQMFYNPMWNLFGDKIFPPGTYYYSDNSMSTPLWYMYDQVLIRPQLRKKFKFESLEIVTKTNNYSLVDERMHPDRTISDHLPIVFEIDDKGDNY